MNQIYLFVFLQNCSCYSRLQNTRLRYVKCVHYNVTIFYLSWHSQSVDFKITRLDFCLPFKIFNSGRMLRKKGESLMKLYDMSFQGKLDNYIYQH